MIKVSEELCRELKSPLLSELQNSFSIDIKVSHSDLDGFGHVNNANYIQWLDQAHWTHLDHMGIIGDVVQETNCGFVVRDTTVTYLAPLLENDIIKVGTEITAFDQRFKMTRKFQLVRIHDSKTVLRGEIHYVSIDLAKGTPKRVPQEFRDAILLNNN